MKDMLFSFDGRMRRSRWWLAQLGTFIAAMIVFVVLAEVFGGKSTQLSAATKAAAGAPMVAGLVALTWANLATSTKRFHDQGLSGWFYLLSLIPLIGSFIVFAMLGFRDSARGDNRFGPSTKYRADTAAVFE